MKNWRPPRLSELTPMISNTGLTHLGSEASNYIYENLAKNAKLIEIIHNNSVGNLI